MKAALRLSSILIFGLFIFLSFLEVDYAEAACAVNEINEGPPLSVDFRVRENGGSIYGLQEIRVVESVNATVDIPNFYVGTIYEVIVTATRIDAGEDFRVVLESINTIGGTSTCSFFRSAEPPENEPPACSVSGVNPGPPLSVVFSVSDSDDGLQAINVLAAYNAEINIPTFSVGDNGPVLVTATRNDPYDAMQVSLSVSDTKAQALNATIPQKRPRMNHRYVPFQA